VRKIKMKQLKDTETHTGHLQRYVPGEGGKPGKYQYEHILVAEKKYGRKLKPGEVVSHEDGNAQNNDPSNLKIMTRAEHNKTDPTHHMGGRTKGSRNGVRKSVNYN
jgi:hypothetical protein